MQSHFQIIEALLQEREVKKAEILIAKRLRAQTDRLEKNQLLLYRAKTRLLNARPESAMDDLVQVQTTTPELFKSPSALELLADSYFARFELSTIGFADRHDAQQALTIYQRIVDEFADYDNLGWVHYRRGCVLLSDSQIDSALAAFHKALLNPSIYPSLTAYCYERMGFIAFYEQRNPRQAMTFLNKAVDTYPVSSDRGWLLQVHILRSRVLRDRQQFDEALVAARVALEIASTSRGQTDMRVGLAEALLTTAELLAILPGQEHEAIDHMEQFLQISKRPLGVDVTWARVYEMLGDAYLATGRFEDAINAYQMVLQFNPYHPWEGTIYYRIARAYYQQGSYRKASQVTEKAIKLAVDEGDLVDFRIYDVYGNALFAMGQYGRAADAYAKAISTAPSNVLNLDKIRQYHQFAIELAR